MRDDLEVIVERFARLELLVETDTLSELAEQLGISADTLQATIKRYNEFVDADKDNDFGRQNLARKLEKAPFHAVEVTPGVHHTMGGLVINTKAEVLNKDGEPIPGLYAAGEVTGGIHGDNRLGGSATPEIMVFGRIAGQQAAEFAKNR